MRTTTRPEPARSPTPTRGLGPGASHPASRLAVVLAALASTGWLSAGCAEAPPAPRSAILIVIDTLRADHLGPWGADRATSPGIDALAARSTRFERAYATAPWTKPSVASILTGQYPSRHGTRSSGDGLAPGAETLAELLGSHGFATAAVVSHTLLSGRWGFTQGFDDFDASHGRGHVYVSTPGVTVEAMQRLDHFASTGERFFLLVHYFDPHYQYLRHGDTGFAATRAGRLDGDEPVDDLRAMLDDLDDDEVGFLRDLYDEEIRHTDEGIRRLLEHLDAAGLADSTAIVLTSDHGEEFLERGWLGHTRSLYEELVHVPLLIHAPGATPNVVTTPVSLVSVAATLLEILGVDASELALHGPSLAPSVLRGAPAPDVPVFAEVDFTPFQGVEKVAYKKAVIDGPLKLILDDRTGQLELYDVVRDPDERDDLASHSSHRSERERLLGLLEAHLADVPPATESMPAAELTDEEIERLRGLGYVAP